MDNQLTLKDLEVMVQFIDISVKRGAVEGNELNTVAMLRSKLVNVLTDAQESAETAEAQPETENSVEDDK